MRFWPASASGFLVIVIAVFALFPFYAIVSSFRSGRPVPVAYLPERFDLSNYVAVFERQPFGQNILNSIIVSGCVVALSLHLASRHPMPSGASPSAAARCCS